MSKKIVLSALLTTLLITHLNAAKQEEVYWERDVYVMVDKLPNEQRTLVYQRYMSIDNSGKKGFLNKDIPRIKEIVTTLDKANKIEKELREY